MAKRLYDALKDCKKDEVTAPFCSFWYNITQRYIKEG